MNQDEWNHILADLARAPSPHNTQPARWKLKEEEVYLYFDKTRVLSVSDPEKRDLENSLGASWYILLESLKKRGLVAHIIERNQDFSKGFYLRGLIEEEKSIKNQKNHLASIHLMTCYRGEFEKSINQYENDHPHVQLITDEKLKGKIASLYDNSLAHFMGNYAYANELYEWLRFSKSNPRYYKDGLSAQMLRLNWFENIFGRFLMHPIVAKILSFIGVLKPVITEEKQNLSAEGFMVIWDKIEGDNFQFGMTLYQNWLLLWEAGYHFCPITSVIDFSSTREILEGLCGKKDGYIIKHILRYGKKPEAQELKLSSRLSADEIQY